LIAIVLIVVVAYAAAYAVFAFLTRNAPPPPSFERKPEPSFQVALDGRWYTRDCGSIEIVGGWVLPSAVRLFVGGEQVRLSEPVDLTQLNRGSSPKRLSATLEIRWPRRDVLVVDEPGSGRLALRQHKPPAC
jgi:hypothetical protein